MSNEYSIDELYKLLKDAGLDAGGSQATVESTQFTPTYGAGAHDPIRSKDSKKKEDDEELEKGDRLCAAGWGSCNCCTPDVCKDHEKYDDFRHMDLIKSADGGIYIAGYASPYVVDDEGHRIELDALKEGLTQYMFYPQFRNVMVAHTGIQVGYVVPEVKDSNGKVYKTRVDDKGLYAVCKLRDDILPGKEVIEAVRKGQLDSFSIRGRGLERKFECESGSCFWSITKIELYEITVCKRGVNPEAKFIVLKSNDVVHVTDEEAMEIHKGATIERRGTDTEVLIENTVDSFRTLLRSMIRSNYGQ